MAVNLELDGLNELLAALLEERQTIVASVRTLRDSRRQKGTFVLGDGAAAGPRLVAVQRQIDVVESIIAAIINSN
ncbi:HOOK family protein [Methylobacterium sp. NEAU K]|uniref:HOOK family protein n=1 Tax=Methylobacterium sp. NEAU K TaxID=3064946 RepID=UPI0027343B0F|nr:HOOK family protein [Methylobacterium sp. NEAU K]MDP4004738.1 HOOK family protein [Methylobacterium sp. NEAU K]